MKPETLISLLADGEFHSGEAIGGHLGISRTAVWKQLKKLSEFGLQIESIKGRGYRLSSALDLLNQDKIQNLLSKTVQEYIDELDVFNSISSTNDLAHKKLTSDDANGYVCFAEHQTSGRGRRGRQWVSPYGRNLYFSVVWNFEEGASILEGLSLAVGVAVARALIEFGVTDVKLKWPNDVLYQNMKLGGVLLEMVGDPTGECQVIIGIGLNVHMDPLQDEIDQPWIALNQILPSVSRNELAASLLNQLIPMLKTFPDKGFAVYQKEWSLMDAYKNQLVEVSSGSRVTVGLNKGVLASGALLLEVDGDDLVFHGGELSLRRLSHDS